MSVFSSLPWVMCRRLKSMRRKSTIHEREREKGEKKKNINFIDLRTKKAAYFDV